MVGEWVIKILMTVTVLGLCALFYMMGCLAYWEWTHTCVRSERVWRDAWVQPMIIGKVVMPIYHPGRYENRCVEWKEDYPPGSANEPYGGEVKHAYRLR